MARGLLHEITGSSRPGDDDFGEAAPLTRRLSPLYSVRHSISSQSLSRQRTQEPPHSVSPKSARMSCSTKFANARAFMLAFAHDGDATQRLTSGRSQSGEHALRRAIRYEQHEPSGLGPDE